MTDPSATLDTPTIPRHRIVRAIGEGGMGVVYEAEQVEPVRRRVALKLLKAGLDTKAFLARFETERQALAMMDHPHIARVLDAGSTAQGHPYYTMEYVSGLPITEAADEARLTTRDRLTLMLAVCDAVQHAHERGIVHRDLKPSNILVQQREHGLVPTVIDFGIAKALHGRLSNQTFTTELYQAVGTAAYMSPEQWDAGPEGIDGRADVYALGVILFELVAGGLPFDPARLARAGPAAGLLLERTPLPTPSQRVNADITRDTLATARRATARELTRELRGDLDLVVLTALAPDRAVRYQSAAALRADLANYLEARPIAARRPSVRYRISRLVRRHRTRVFVAGALTIAAILGGWRTVATTRLETQVKGALRWLVTAQEQHRARSGRYANSVSELPNLTQLPGVTVSIVSATANGWSGIGSPTGRTSLVCSVYVSSDTTAVGDPICTTR